MFIQLDYLYQKYNLNINGILHVGAHKCEEIHCYEKYVPRNQILWIEAIEKIVIENKQNYNNLLIENEIISDIEEEIKFNISSNGQSSSILELDRHKELHPDIYFIDSFYKKTKRLDHILDKYNVFFNYIVFDIQGAELKAIKSMGDYLYNVDYIYTEVNGSSIYKDCNLVNELDDYLNNYNFIRVESSWFNGDDTTWGDAFYIKFNYI